MGVPSCSSASGRKAGWRRYASPFAAKPDRVPVNSDRATRPDHRWRGFHRNQPGRSFAAAAGRPVLIYDDLSRAGVEQEPGVASRSTMGTCSAWRSPTCATDSTLRRAVQTRGTGFSFRRAGGRDHQPDGPAPRFRSQRRRHAQSAGRDSRHWITRRLSLFTSTNKVYGSSRDLALEKNGTRYQPLDAHLRTGSK